MRSRVLRISSSPILKLAKGAIQLFTSCRPTPYVTPAGMTPSLSGVTPARFAASSESIETPAPVSNTT